MFHFVCQSPVDEPVVLSDEVIFPLTVSLDKLPVNTLKVKVWLVFLSSHMHVHSCMWLCVLHLVLRY